MGNLLSDMLVVRDVLLGPPHDVQCEWVDSRWEFLLGLVQRDLLARVQVLNHHARQDLLQGQEKP